MIDNSKIDYPVAFGPNGWIGVAASEDIPPNTVESSHHLSLTVP